jgi:hypothetical protein
MSQPLFQFGDKPPRPIEELTYDEAERVYAMLFPPPEPQQDTAAACEDRHESASSVPQWLMSACAEGLG